MRLDPLSLTPPEAILAFRTLGGSFHTNPHVRYDWGSPRKTRGIPFDIRVG